MAQKPRKRPSEPSIPLYWRKGPFSPDQNLKPMTSCLGFPPAETIMDARMRPTMRTTLRDANQNSDSPYTRTLHELRMVTVTSATAIQAAALTSGSQYEKRTATADSSAGSRIVQRYQ